MSASYLIAQVAIPDGWVDLMETMEPGSKHGDPGNTFWVNTVRDGVPESRSRHYKTLQDATNRFNTIVAAHTPPAGYEPPAASPALSEHPLYGRFS